MLDVCVAAFSFPKHVSSYGESIHDHRPRSPAAAGARSCTTDRSCSWTGRWRTRRHSVGERGGLGTMRDGFMWEKGFLPETVPYVERHRQRQALWKQHRQIEDQVRAVWQRLLFPSRGFPLGGWCTTLAWPTSAAPGRLCVYRSNSLFSRTLLPDLVPPS